MSLLSEYTDQINRIRTTIMSGLLNQVADTAKQAMSLKVHELVYDPFPTSSFRRKDDGGLSDVNNYSESLESSGDTYTLTISNDTPFQEDESPNNTLTQVVQKGLKAFLMPAPRPFVGQASEALEADGITVNTLLSVLRMNGIETTKE